MLLFSHSCRFGKLTEARSIHSSGAAFNGIWEGHPIPERHKLCWDRTAAAGKAASYDVHESTYKVPRGGGGDSPRRRIVAECDVVPQDIIIVHLKIGTNVAGP